jgi:dihydroorotase
MTIRAFISARLIDPASGRDEIGSLLVEGGLIKGIGPGISIPKEADIRDCNGDVLSPGLIDMQSFATDGLSAAKGGITTAVLMPDYEPIIENNISVEYVLQKTSLNEPIKYKVLGAATEALEGQTMAEIGRMEASGALGFTAT